MPKQYSPWYDSDIEQSRLLAALPKLAAFAVLPNKLFLTRQCRAVIWPSWRSGKRLTTTLNARWGSVNIFGGVRIVRDAGADEASESTYSPLATYPSIKASKSRFRIETRSVLGARHTMGCANCHRISSFIMFSGSISEYVLGLKVSSEGRRPPLCIKSIPDARIEVN
jgi:hypothetical protein